MTLTPIIPLAADIIDAFKWLPLRTIRNGPVMAWTLCDCHFQCSRLQREVTAFNQSNKTRGK